MTTIQSMLCVLCFMMETDCSTTVVMGPPLESVLNSIDTEDFMIDIRGHVSLVPAPFIPLIRIDDRISRMFTRGLFGGVMVDKYRRVSIITVSDEDTGKGLGITTLLKQKEVLKNFCRQDGE